MATLVNWLERFNRKERYFLVAQALGKPKFELDEQFRKTLSEKAGPGMDIPAGDGVFVAMDYHLDWIHAAMKLRGRESDGAALPNRTDRDNHLVLTGNQEDIDLLVAWSESDVRRSSCWRPRPRPRGRTHS